MAQGVKRTQWKQWAACITATMTMVCVGTVYGWITTGLSRLMAEDSPIPLDSDQGSWLVSLTTIGSMIGPFIGVACADSFGRKKTLLLTSLLFTVGWLQIIFAIEVPELYMARVIQGIGIGISYTTNPMYVSEVADVGIRGAVGTLIAVNVFTGSVLACSIGPFVEIKELPMVLLVVPVLFVLAFLWFPETPHFLASQKRYEEAARSLGFFRGIATLEEAKVELDVIMSAIKRNAEERSWRGKLTEMLQPTNRKALLIVVILILAQLLSGNFTTLAYMEVLFRKADVGMNTDLATVIVLALSLLFCGVATATVERIGRRPLLLASTLGAAFTLAILGTYLVLNDNDADLGGLSWLPVVVVVAFQASYQVGLGAIPDALIGELFPTNVKSIASAAVTVSDGTFGFAVTKLYQVAGDALGEYVVYYFFAASCLAAFVFVLVVVPETRNRSLNEIQMELAEKGQGCCSGRSAVTLAE